MFFHSWNLRRLISEEESRIVVARDKEGERGKEKVRQLVPKCSLIGRTGFCH
jgi:hypothetical protein